MKRYSLTEIIGKVQLQTLEAFDTPNSQRYFVLTRRAAVNEIIRLEADQITEAVQQKIDLMEEICANLKSMEK